MIFNMYIKKNGTMISKKTVEINDVKYVNELAKIPVILSPIDFTAELILSVTSLGSLSICVNEKLTICSASFAVMVLL